MSWKEIFPHDRIINDPQKLVELSVEIEKTQTSWQIVQPFHEETGTMQKNVAPWMEVCERTAKEQNPEGLMELANEVIRLLDEKKRRPVSASEASNTDERR